MIQYYKASNTCCEIVKVIYCIPFSSPTMQAVLSPITSSHLALIVFIDDCKYDVVTVLSQSCIITHRYVYHLNGRNGEFTYWA